MRSFIDAAHPVLMTRDVGASIRFCEQLRFVRVFSSPADLPRCAAVRRDGVVRHLERHDASGWEGSGDRPTYRSVVADVDRLYREFGAAGVRENIKPVAETARGTRELHVRDPARNGPHFYRVL